jgi:hypothetical protein
MRKAFSVVGVLVAVVLVSIMATTRGADAAAAVLRVFVTNDASNPVPTQAIGTTAVAGTVSVDNFPADTPPPLWQGTPYAEYVLNTNVEFEECSEFPVPADDTLFVTRVVADFDMPTGASGYASVRYTPLGGDPVKLPMPMTQGGLVQQVDGNRIDYNGAVEIGQPVSAIRVCFVSTGGLVGEATALGFVLP